MTSRESLALGRDRGSRARRALLVAVAPRRLAVSRRGRRRGPGRGRSRSPWPRSRSAIPARPSIGNWIVGRRGRRAAGRRHRRRRRSPASSSRPRTWRLPARRSSPRGCVTAMYFVALYAFWAVLLAVPLAGNLGAAWLLVEATTAASALLVGFSGKARALEAGWKYLVLTSLGLGVALLGIVHPRRRRAGRRARRALLAGARRPRRRRPTTDARRLPAAARRPRRQDRLGAGPQLASRRPLRGAAARLGAALGRAAAGRAARRLALRARARAGHRRTDGAGGADRASGSSRWRSRCRSSGGRWPGSGCSPTRASSTWA